MNGRFFMQALGGIDDEFIARAADEKNIAQLFADFEEEETDTAPKNIPAPVKHIKIRRLILAACVAALLLAVAAVAVCSFGQDSLSALYGFGDRLEAMFEGETAEYKGGTVTKKDEAVTYSTVRDFFDKTDYDVMYPDKFPQGIEITRVLVTGSYGENYEHDVRYKKIYFVTNKVEEYSVTVNMNPDANKFFLTDPNITMEIINGLECYITLQERNNINCYFIHNGYVYSILTTSYENIVTIVSNMKEYGG